MVSRFIGWTLALITLTAALCACGQDPTTVRSVPWFGPSPHGIDERTGVLAIHELLDDASYRTALRRLEDGELVALTPSIPGGADALTSVAWFEEGALVGDFEGRLFRAPAGHDGWEVISLVGCDPERPQAYLSDAPAFDSAWVVAMDVSFEEATLCHFDGEALTQVERLDFAPEALVELDGVLFATDTLSQRVMRRPAAGGEWAPVDGLDEIGVLTAPLVARREAVFAVFVDDPSRPGEDVYWRVDGARPERVDGIPGMSGEVWRVEHSQETSTHCSFSVWSNMEVCIERVDVAEYRALLVGDDAPREVGLLHLEYPDTASWYETLIVGPGQLVFAGSSGQLYVTE